MPEPRASRRAFDGDYVKVDVEEWRAELALIEDWFAMLGPRLPAALRTELTAWLTA